MPRRGLWDLLTLFAGKSSGVIVALIFLPLYNKTLGVEQFGIVAVILSVQAFAVMMDLGMATLIARYAALAISKTEQTAAFLNSVELALAVFYFGLLSCTLLVLPLLGYSNHQGLIVVGSILLCWLFVLQNIYYASMLARMEYQTANLIQTAGNLVRGFVTAGALIYYSATPLTFVAAQIITTALHCSITRISLNRSLGGAFLLFTSKTRYKVSEAIGLIKQGRSITLFTVAGASVMQLDKPLISAFSSAANVAPYFLATTVCMLPIALLAGPLSQYFQPKILIAIEAQNTQAAQQLLQRFVLLLLLAIGLPSLALWLVRDWAIGLWLGPSATNAIIAHYVAIMLPGFAMGALGFVPYALLLSSKDFRYQAQMSVALTVVTLAAVALFAWLQRVDAVCFTYMFYHIASTALSWARACNLPQVNKLAWGALISASKGIALLCITTVLVLQVQF